jgi:hypothetical protein
MLGIRTAHPEPPKQVGLFRSGVHAASVVEHLACIDAVRDELGARLWRSHRSNRGDVDNCLIHI